ncbi:hypothetical protein H0H93_007961 [Arthromyces matolae]|nr:hypothetical protein H0H93_007961 [Arthromyces matolae]
MDKNRKKRQYDSYDSVTSSSLRRAPQAQRLALSHTSYEPSASSGSLSLSSSYIPIDTSHTLPLAHKHLEEASEVSHAPVYDVEPGNEVYDNISHHWMDPNDVDNIDEPAKRRRTLATDNPLLLWTQDIDLYLREFLRREAPGKVPLTCSNCSASRPSDFDYGALHRCKDCVSNSLLCSECVLDSHRSLPFHRLETWNGHYFEPRTLTDLGFVLRVGHKDGSECINVHIVKDFALLHVNGLHEIIVHYCDCHHVIPRKVQLLRAGLFPASTIRPKTAATFDLLRNFQLLSFMSKISALEYYQTLVRLTDNTGTRDLLMVREWRHIKLLKRGGRGHDTSGVAGTKAGECAVLCPACPLPGINLPENWRSSPPEKEWLYAIFLGIDANFRLKRLNVSSEEKDPGLNHGYAYFVDAASFSQYLNTFNDKIEDDVSDCNNHDAIKSASIRGAKGLASSGVGKTECARHDMKRAVSLGDLQKGERYVNMDYFFGSSLNQNTPKIIVISYDIACQWSRNLRKRFEVYGGSFGLPDPYADRQLRFVVPKFHLLAHVEKCKTTYSLNLLTNVGRTDGEAPERGWAAINAIAGSTKEMGPGSRRDTLDDHFGDYNWRKYMSLHTIILRKAEEAIQQREEHVLAFEEFDAALPEEDVQEWTTLVQAWERDPSKKNPFAATLTKITENAVRLELALEDEARLREDLTTSLNDAVHQDVPPGRLIAQGLELEDHQRILRIDSTKIDESSTSLQRSKIIERSNRLFRKIEAWMSIQSLYIPLASTLRLRDDQLGSEEHVPTADINLYLPSEMVGKAYCDPKFLDIEWRLRWAQAHETLHEIRRIILLRSQMRKSKEELITGQRMHTRSNALLKDIADRIRHAVQKYKAIRNALLKLDRLLEKGNWASTLCELTDDDVGGITAAEDDRPEGSRSLSWIWKLAEADTVEGEGKQEALRIEWCKARARAHRWQEECLLLKEEIRRVIAFFNYQERLWAGRALERYPHVDSAMAAGFRAYGWRQSSIRRQMRMMYEQEWSDLSSRLSSGIGAQVGKTDDGDILDCDDINSDGDQRNING